MEVFFETLLAETFAMAIRLVVQRLIEWWGSRSTAKTFAIA